ncbi:hypothetical protein HY640_03330 [Candidatus Woesearchaeota archaeon]|nr:hypothetical protein [Candidatus Woesearchaeota archaeon]
MATDQAAQNPAFLIEAASLLAAAACSAYAYFKLSKQQNRTVSAFIGVNAAFLAIQAVLSLMWGTGQIPLQQNDFLLTRAIFSAIQAITILLIVHSMTGKKTILFMLLLFVIGSLPIRPNMTYFFASITLTSYMLITLILGYLIMSGKENNSLRKAAITGTAYAAISAATFIAYFIAKINATAYLFPAQNILLAATIYLLGKGHATPKPAQEQGKKHLMIPVLFAKYAVFVTSVCMFVFFSTVSIHELGHTIAARMYGCDVKTVIYGGQENPHTEFFCSGRYSDEIVTLAGIAMPIAVAAAFMFTQETLIIKIAYLMMGFNLFISFRDLKELYVSDSAILIIIALSVITVLFSIVRLSIYYLYQQASAYFLPEPRQTKQKEAKQG